MEDGPTLVFVEVKCRQSLNYGDPEEAITPTKQRHLTQAALCYVKAKRVTDKLIRFDSLSIGPDGIRLFKNAFQPSGQYYF
jgi:putative endonuclease